MSSNRLGKKADHISKDESGTPRIAVLRVSNDGLGTGHALFQIASILVTILSGLLAPSTSRAWHSELSVSTQRSQANWDSGGKSPAVDIRCQGIPLALNMRRVASLDSKE